MQIPLSKLPELSPLLIAIGLSLSLIHTTSAAEPNKVLEPALMDAYDQDRAALGRLRENLFQLAGQVKTDTLLFGPKPVEDTIFLRPEIRQKILAIWYSILDNYLALDALAETYNHFHQFEHRAFGQRAFHLARGVFLTQYRIALEVIPVFEQNSVMDTILNEAAPPLGLPQGVYAHFKYQYLNVIKAGRYAALEAVAQLYQAAYPPDPQLKNWASEDSRLILAAGKGPGPLMTVKNGLLILKRAGQSAWFPAQKGVARWMGRTKVWRPRQYLIQPAQIDTVAGQIEPGDILLERREWYLTNVGIPGFWTHAALFIGSRADRDELSKHPEVAHWLHQQRAGSLDELIERNYPLAHAALEQPYKDGHLPQVIEALAPGVSLTSLEYSATCDSLAVLRPRLSLKDKAAAILRAMTYFGRPYDFAFDFGSDQSLVCTELIVKSYLPGKDKQGLWLPMEQVMGQMVTPANAFVRRWDQTHGTQEQQLDLVLFLDGNEKEKRAAESDSNTFRHSWKRPKWHILTQLVP